MSLATSSFYGHSGLQSTVRLSQQGSLPSNASNNSVAYAALPSELREDFPVQRCRFSVPKCITKAMKAIGKFFRSIFKRFRSDLETTSVSRDPDVALDKGRQRWIVHSTNSQWQQELVDALIAQGVRAEDAEHVKTTRDRTFIAFDLQEFQVVQKHKAYHIRRIA